MFNEIMVSLRAKLKYNTMASKTPYNKDNGKKISFEQLVELIGTTCDYKFCIVDETIDNELMALAAKHGLDLTGYKHVIETSGARHSEPRHGNKSFDRTPLSIEDYLMIPYIIKHHDKVEISNHRTKKHGLKTIIYRKTIGNQYVYVEEIRIGRNKSLAFVSLYKRPIKKASQNREACSVIAGGVVPDDPSLTS